jgi:hypothetical protein
VPFLGQEVLELNKVCFAEVQEVETQERDSEGRRAESVREFDPAFSAGPLWDEDVIFFEEAQCAFHGLVVDAQFRCEGGCAGHGFAPATPEDLLAEVCLNLLGGGGN